MVSSHSSSASIQHVVPASTYLQASAEVYDKFMTCLLQHSLFKLSI